MTTTRPDDENVVSISRARIELDGMFRRARTSQRPITVTNHGQAVGQLVAVGYDNADQLRIPVGGTHDVTVHCHVCGHALGFLSRDRDEAAAETATFLIEHLNHTDAQMAAAPAFAARLGIDEQPLPFPETA